MKNDYHYRAEDILVRGSDAELRAIADALRGWVKRQAKVVRSLGPTHHLRAVISTARLVAGAILECEFASRRGDLYTVSINVGGELDLSDHDAIADDLIGALNIAGALLDELGMSAVIG